MERKTAAVIFLKNPLILYITRQVDAIYDRDLPIGRRGSLGQPIHETFTDTKHLGSQDGDFVVVVIEESEIVLIVRRHY